MTNKCPGTILKVIAMVLCTIEIVTFIILSFALGVVNGEFIWGLFILLFFGGPTFSLLTFLVLFTIGDTNERISMQNAQSKAKTQETKEQRNVEKEYKVIEKISDSEAKIMSDMLAAFGVEKSTTEAIAVCLNTNERKREMLDYLKAENGAGRHPTEQQIIQKAMSMLE